MQVQIYSDIHLEYYSKIPLIEPKSKILILAGDIGYLDSDIYNEFMNYVSKNWNYVFIVLGNHEYYHDTKTFTEINKQARQYFSKFNNIVLLDRDIYLLEDILIIGCTLWSNIDERVKDYINDFNYIKMLDEKNNFVKLSIQEYQNLHQKNKDFLLSSFLDNYKKVIIITHYPLTQENTSHPKYNKDPKWIKNYFSNQIDLNNNDKEIICISGHTHYSFDFVKNNIRYISNQFGYKNEIKNSKLKIDGVFELFSKDL
jgi:predicted phosphohydrolase